MFEFSGSPVPIRSDLLEAYGKLWEHFAAPGATMTGHQRISLLQSAREDDPAAAQEAGVHPAISGLGASLLHDPAAVHGSHVRGAAEATSFPHVVETISLVSMLSAVDGAHRALTSPLEPLPDPLGGEPTGEVQEGLKPRRTHVPVPPGPIPITLDLVPESGRVFQESFGPQYMTGPEMMNDRFERRPGLNRAQMEIISSRTSLINECFY